MREQWNSKLGFLLAAIGSAVGLGNIWRFPYTAAASGGGAFMLPYFFAILTAGIPLLILEYTIGKKYRGGAPVTLAKINKKFECLGWIQVMVAFMILVYYFVIVVWTASYMGYSLSQGWGEDTKTFFFGKFLQLSKDAFHLGSINTNLIVPFIIVWLIVIVIMYRGISKGIELACKVTLPLLLLMMIVLVIRGVTLPGAAAGLDFLFKPDWSALTKPSIWVAAYGQIFYSLSIGFAIMIAYSSYLPKKSDIVNSAFITATANHGFEILAGIGVFSIMGFMAQQQGTQVADIAGSGGLGAAFIAFPTAISSLPALNTLFGLCFFGALFIAGITSLISIAQAVISGVQDKFDFSHKKAVTLVIVPTFLMSFLYITGGGLYILDIVDAFTNQIGIALGGVLEVILIMWFFNPETLRLEANKYSNFSVGKWWTFSLKYLTVFVLGFMTIKNTFTFVTEGYGGYPTSAVVLYGWGSLALIIVVSVIFTTMKGKAGYSDYVSDEDETN